MRGRSGRTNPSRPPRLIVGGRLYEQFKPMSEWRQEDDHDTLLVYLPGFQKEYIKVTAEDVNTVRVRGERLVAENKWSRFQEDFRVPENCDIRGIRARFDGGILTITMPRKITATATTTTAPRIAPKAEEQPVRRTKQEEALPKPKEESKEKATALESEKKPDRPRSPLKGSTMPPQPMPPSSSSRPPIQEPIKTVPEAREKDEELTFGSLPKIVPRKDTQNIVEKPIEERENRQKGVAEKTDLDEGKRKETSLDEEMKRASEGRMGKLKDAGVSHGGFLGDKLEEKKKVVAMREVTEDRKLLMNVGVGVLVIVALGVYVSYAIGLIGRGK